MLPVTRANLESICCTCLVNISKDIKQIAYDIRKEKNLFNMLKVTAYTDVLMNPLNLKYIQDYCRKVCDVCFRNVKMAFNFQERLISSIEKMKDILKIGSKAKELKSCCHSCLKSQKFVINIDQENNTQLKFLEGWMGGIKKGTDEVAVVDDTLIPKQLCESCLEELQSIEEFQLLSLCSFEHIVSEMCKNLTKMYTIAKQKTAITYDKSEPIFDSREEIVFKCEEEDAQFQETICNNTPLIDLTDVQNEENNIEGTKISDDGKENPCEMVLETCFDQSNRLPEIRKTDDEVLVLKCEEEETQYQEEIYNRSTLTTNIGLEDSQNIGSNIVASSILVNDEDYSAAIEGDDAADSELVIVISDSNTTDELTKISEYLLSHDLYFTYVLSNMLFVQLVHIV